MSNNYFKFKQFTVFQDKTAMKVGVDSVLLGAWIKCRNAQNILDIGTGTGLLALMLAQKSDAKITAVEIDRNAYEQACENVENSIWNNIEPVNLDIQEFAKHAKSKFDLIVCNPPYFHKSTAAENAQRTIARHDDNLTINALFQAVANLISPQGSFYLIYPYERKYELLSEAAKYNLQTVQMLAAKGNELKKPNRILIEFSPKNADNAKNNCAIEQTMNIRNSATNKYSREYIEMTKDYYFKDLNN